ncbi:MAG: membrane protein [Ignavibacteriales bacterium]
MNLPLLYYLDLFGVAVFAISGALTASEKKLDLYGVVVISIVTAIGGGTLRDLLLDRHPIFWFEDPVLLIVIITAAIATIIYTRFHHPPLRVLLIADAFGLGLFAISGAQIAEAQNLSPLIVVVMAAITGTAGGLTRDILCNEIPMILKKDIYATAAISGAAIYLILKALGVDGVLAGVIGSAFVFAVRLAAITFRLHQPESKLPT